MSSVAQLLTYHASFWFPLDYTFLPTVGWVSVEFIAPIQESAFSRHAEGMIVQISVDILLSGWPI